MSTKRNRRRLVTFAGVVAASLALAVPALACVVNAGRLEVISGSTTSTNVGSGAFHGDCYTTGGAAANPGGTITVRVSPYVNSGGSDTCPSNQLPDSALPVVNPDELPNPQATVKAPAGLYNVLLYNPNTYLKTTSPDGTTTWSYDPNGSLCYRESFGAIKIGSLAVVNGSGEWTGSLPTHQADGTPLTANGLSDDSSICVTATVNDSYGNIAPITIL